MLVKLSINNYSIVKDAEICFSPNLNIITGETGAGKSILMSALGLLLGEKAEGIIVENLQTKCIVEGCFLHRGLPNVLDFLRTNNLDEQEEIIIRKEINPNGKSRAFINDTPVTLNHLQALGTCLVDKHRQFDNLLLVESDFQRNVLDALAANFKLLHQFQNTFDAWQASATKAEDLKQKKQAFDKEFDFHQYLYQELVEVNLTNNELEEAESELSLLQNSESISKLLNEVSFLMKNGDSPVLSRLRVLNNQLDALAAQIPKLVEFGGRLNSVYIEMQDVVNDAEQLLGEMDYDEARVLQLQDRLNLGYKLQKKHQVKTTNALLEVQESFKSKLQSTLQLDEEITEMEQEAFALHKKCNEKAEEISNRRAVQVTHLEQSVNAMLRQIGMPNAKIKVGLTKANLKRSGIDDVQFLFDANQSGKFYDIKKVASGGELSRLMLCIKSLVAENINWPTIIFDEIDSGISGEAAKQVGEIMKQISQKHQVISITHQPQIAGKADTHLLVYKIKINEVVQTKIKQLTKEERITEIAKMINGEDISHAALHHAKEMIN